YDLARGGDLVALEPRRVRVYAIDLLHYEWPVARLRVDCGRGTYVSAIARDLGAALGVGGYLTALRRTAVGPFTADGAVTPERLAGEGVDAHLRAYADPRQT
ncbi:MAG: tRNA pseudouridine(55) synthase, partial [uncultured Phycisphaerae bacterium]